MFSPINGEIFISSSGHSDENKTRWKFNRRNILPGKIPDVRYTCTCPCPYSFLTIWILIQINSYSNRTKWNEFHIKQMLYTSTSHHLFSSFSRVTTCNYSNYNSPFGSSSALSTDSSTNESEMVCEVLEAGYESDPWLSCSLLLFVALSKWQLVGVVKSDRLPISEFCDEPGSKHTSRQK